MADLRRKLARLGVPPRAQAPHPVQLVPRLTAPDIPGDPGAVLWTPQSTPHGKVNVVLRELGQTICHGEVALSRCLQVRAEHIATLALDDAFREVDLTRLLFLDTETTGLAGGAGTLPFLVGLGYFDAQGWRTEQLVLSRPGDEAPLLRYLATHLQRSSAVVTYNGKSFDWPLLRMRFILNRVCLPPLRHHLDLLHCARRLYKRQGGPLRLINLEQSLLNFNRQGDIEGAAIPELYFAFLRGAPAHTLAPVILHNGHDLAAMAAILAALSATLSDPEASLERRDCLSLAELQLRRGDRAAAQQMAVHASSGPPATPSPLHAIDAHLMVARLRRRERNHAGCAEALQAALRCAEHVPLRRSDVHLALAKVHEHGTGDLLAALAHAGHTAPAEGEDAQVHRLARLQRRHARLVQ